MTSTTTNYGWTVPTSSDLVKNGATAISTVGSSVDTALWNSGFGQAGKNKIMNGDFGIWQRGTSFSNPANEAYLADRFNIVFDGSGSTRTVSQQTFTPATAPVAGYESSYFMRLAQTVAGSGGTYLGYNQRIENVRTFAGQTVTLSFWAKADATRTVLPNIQQNFGSGGSSTVVVTGFSSINLTTSWVRYSVSVSIPSISGKTIGTSSYLQLFFGFAANTVQTIVIWGVQLEYGSVTTPFQTATGTIQGELAACKYYFERRQGGTSFGSIPLFGQCISTTTVYIPIFYTPKRTTPTMTQGGTWKQYTANATANAATYSLVARSANDGYAVATSSGLVAGNASITEWDTSSYLDISAEL